MLTTQSPAANPRRLIEPHGWLACSDWGGGAPHADE
jgi:hypothetical protein